MTKLEKIEHDISSLPANEVHKLADWLAEFCAKLWDEQIEADVKAGKLDKFVSEAKAEITAGKVRPL